MEPSTLVEPLVQGTEGVFCPNVMDAHTGRFERLTSSLKPFSSPFRAMFKPKSMPLRASFESLPPPPIALRYENVLTGDMLSFERNGRWCVGSDCSEPLGGATPLGAVMATHQVVNVSDFDGHFEASKRGKIDILYIR